MALFSFYRSHNRNCFCFKWNPFFAFLCALLIVECVGWHRAALRVCLSGCWVLQRIKNQRVFHFKLKHPTIEFISTSLTPKRRLRKFNKGEKCFLLQCAIEFFNWSFSESSYLTYSFVLCAALKLLITIRLRVEILAERFTELSFKSCDFNLIKSFQFVHCKREFPVLDWLEFIVRHRKLFIWRDMFAVRAISIWKWEAFYDQRFALKRNEQSKEKLHLINAGEEKINSSESSLGFPTFRMRYFGVKKKIVSNFAGKRVKISEESIQMWWFSTFSNSHSQQIFQSLRVPSAEIAECFSSETARKLRSLGKFIPNQLIRTPMPLERLKWPNLAMKISSESSKRITKECETTQKKLETKGSLLWVRSLDGTETKVFRMRSLISTLSFV